MAATPKKRRRKSDRRRVYNPNSDPRNIPGMREKMWAPGQSGNPSGPRPRKSLEAIVGDLLQETIGSGPDAMSRMEALGVVIVNELLKQKMNTPLMKEFLAREWPVVQKVDVNATGQIQILFDDQDRQEIEGPKETPAPEAPEGGASDGLRDDGS